MEQAAVEEKARKAAAADASKKRATAATPVAEAPESKRPKLEHEPTPTAGAGGFDFSALPATLVTDLIVANLQAFTENALIGLVQAYRHKKATASVSAAAPPEIPGLTSTPPPSRGHAAEYPVPTGPAGTQRAPPSGPRADREKKAKSVTPPPPPAPVKIEEPVDPLKMDIDDEEIEYEPDRLNLEVRSDRCFSSSS